MKFRDHISKVARINYAKLKEDEDDKNSFKALANASLALTILFNRRRLGDVQYMEISCYLKDFKSNDQAEFWMK